MRKLLILPLLLLLQSSAYYHIQVIEKGLLKTVSEQVEEVNDGVGVINIDTGITGMSEGAVRIQTQDSDILVLGGESYQKSIISSDNFVYQLKVNKVKDKAKGDEHVIIQILVYPYKSR